MANYQIAYGKIDGKGQSIKLESGDGIKEIRNSDANGNNKKKKGEIYFDFDPHFENDPAVVVTGAEDTPPYPRVNEYKEGEEDALDRKKTVRVDCNGRGDTWAKGESYAARDTKFYALAVSKCKDADNAKVQVVAGVLDSNGTVAYQYGGLSSDTSGRKTGNYHCKFSTPFTGTPTVLATVEHEISNHSEAKVLSVRVTEVTKTDAKLTIHEEDGEKKGVLADAKVHVLAIGPAEQRNVGRFDFGVVDRKAGSNKVGNDKSTVTDTARYTVNLGGTGFEKLPVVIASAEHVKKAHLRQHQIGGIEKGRRGGYDILKVNSVNGNGTLNNCAFHFIAYASS